MKVKIPLVWSVIVSLVAAVVLPGLGWAVGHRLGLSQIVSVNLGAVPALWTAFPVMRHFSPRLRFRMWFETALLIGLVTSLLSMAFP